MGVATVEEAVVDTVEDVTAEITEAEVDTVEDVTERMLPLTGRPGTRRMEIEIFTQKTAEFYRNFLDRLYCVADLLIDRPESKPPDLDPAPDPKPPQVGSVSTRTTAWEVLVGKPTWTKKWSFEHFVKRRRRKSFEGFFCFNVKIVFSFHI